MTTKTLEYLKNSFLGAGIPYEFMKWTQKLDFPYFVGNEGLGVSPGEGGEHTSLFVLTGFTNDKYSGLYSYRDTVRELFPETGKTAILSDGQGVCVAWEGSFPVEPDDDGIGRIQINLLVKEYMTNV